jgi:hypothetical protein
MRDQDGFIKSNKLRGEWAELRFMALAAEHGLSVSKPWGEMAPYDVGVEHNGRFFRVQVKSTTVHRRENSYECNVPYDGGRRFTGQQIDFVAAYVIPVDMWYILPAAVAARLKGRIRLSPHSKGHKYEAYAEAWHLLREDANPLPGSPSDSSSAPDPGSDSAQQQIEIPDAAPDPVASAFHPEGVVVKRMQDCFERMLSRGSFKR